MFPKGQISDYYLINSAIHAQLPISFPACTCAALEAKSGHPCYSDRLVQPLFIFTFTK